MHLSVIVPTFNRARTLTASLDKYLDALARQGVAHGLRMELIVVNDGSSDDSAAVVLNHFARNPLVRLVNLPVNSGPGPARDAGLAQARGDWVWFLDDDDEINLAGLGELLPLLTTQVDGRELIAHSLKGRYEDGCDASAKGFDALRLRLGRQILAFKEKQEVFNFVVRREMLLRQRIHFSSGVHEDIRYVFDLVRHARQILVLPYQVLNKQHTEGAITAQMSPRRIDGYLKAHEELQVTLVEPGMQAYGRGLDLLAQTLGVILYLISREERPEQARALLSHLAAQVDERPWLSQALSVGPSYSAKSSNFKYASSHWTQNRAAAPEALWQQLRAIFRSRLSCKDLNASLFLGPDEIRACCKRFFVNGIQKGDVVLLKDAETISLPVIEQAKKRLIDRINADEAPECSGCPYIERYEEGEGGIDYVSLENFSYCNMRCTYCSPKYYGGQEAKYNAADIVAQLAVMPGGFAQGCHVVWGGGEPTLSPRFEPINHLLNTMPQVNKIRVLSNSLRHSESLEQLLAHDKFQLVTSIDAGAQALFLQIRGKGEINAVLGNLQRYHARLSDKRRLTIKYIMRPDNLASDELQAFVEKVTAAGLMDCLFQVSCDFTLPSAVADMVCAMYELGVRLYTAGARIVFFDDLIRDRVQLDVALVAMLRERLDRLGLQGDFVMSPDAPRAVVLWGLGKQSDWYLRHTTSGQAGLIRGVVGSCDDVLAQPDLLEVHDLCFFPSGVQSMYEIVRNIEAAGWGARIARFLIA